MWSSGLRETPTTECARQTDNGRNAACGGELWLPRVRGRSIRILHFRSPFQILRSEPLFPSSGERGSTFADLPIVLERKGCPQRHQSPCTNEVSTQARGVAAALPRLRISQFSRAAFERHLAGSSRKAA